MTKDRTIGKLKEECENVYSFIRFFLFLYGACILSMTIFLLACLLFSDGIAAALSDPASGGVLDRALAMMLSIFIGENLVGAGGALHLSRIAVEILSSIFTYALMFYIFNCLANIFTNMKKEETPLTLENASRWKKCSRIFAVLATILFWISFAAPGLILTILFPLMASCFFQALSLIFEYGSQLQQESDETL